MKDNEKIKKAEYNTNEKKLFIYMKTSFIPNMGSSVAEPRTLNCCSYTCRGS